MHKKFVLVTSIAFILTGCDQGVELTEQQNTLGATGSITDPLFSGDPLTIDDSQARTFTEINENTPTPFVMDNVRCVSDTDTITPDEMSFTNGFVREPVSELVPIDAVRARNVLEGDDEQFIEVCVQSGIDRDYFIETVVSGPSLREDSFFFTVGEGEPVIYDVGLTNQDENGFAQDFVRSRETDPLRVSLRAGANVLRFHYRERNTALAEVSFIRASNTVSEAPIDPEAPEFSAGLMRCAEETALEPELIASLIDQHIPSDEFVFSFQTVFNDKFTEIPYFVRDSFNSARVFCARDFGSVESPNGPIQKTNVFFPTLAPTLILGSEGIDTLVNNALTDNIVFYGFGGDDTVQWQVGGQFFGGDGDDKVIGLTAGVFDGGSGNDTAQAATADAELLNATAVQTSVPPQPLGTLEVTGLDDDNTFVRWPNDTPANITIQGVITNEIFNTTNSFDDQRFLVIAQRFGSSHRVSARSIVPLNDEVSLLSAEATSVEFSKLTRSELISQFGGEHLRGPERIESFIDATVSTDEIRWLSTTPEDSNVVIRTQLADSSVINSTTRETIAQALDIDINSFELGCAPIAGDSTYAVLAIASERLEVFGFDSSTLELLWQRQLSNIESSLACLAVRYSGGAYYFENVTRLNGFWVDTVRVSETGAIDRVPAPQLELNRFGRAPRVLHRVKGAGTTGISILEESSTLEEFPSYRETIVAVHQFDGSGTASRTFRLTDLRPFDENDIFSLVLDTYTDGTHLWLITRYSLYEYGVVLVDIASGNVLNNRRFEPTDNIFASSRFHRIRVTNTPTGDVLEIGRSGRLVRLDAFSLERLEDVKVFGDVNAFDNERVHTLVTGDEGVSSYSFPR